MHSVAFDRRIQSDHGLGRRDVDTYPVNPIQRKCKSHFTPDFSRHSPDRNDRMQVCMAMIRCMYSDIYIHPDGRYKTHRVIGVDDLSFIQSCTIPDLRDLQPLPDSRPLYPPPTPKLGTPNRGKSSDVRWNHKSLDHKRLTYLLTIHSKNTIRLFCEFGPSVPSFHPMLLGFLCRLFSSSCPTFKSCKRSSLHS